MKKIFFTLALVVIGITASYAQKPQRDKLTAEQRAERAATVLEKKLTLTAEQKQKVKQIELDRIKKNDEWRNEDGKAMKAKMEDRKVFAQANKAKLDAILTADQQKTLAASREEMRGKIKDRRGEKGGDRKGPRKEKGTPPPPATTNH